jgi:hypothetical protein
MNASTLERTYSTMSQEDSGVEPPSHNLNLKCISLP